MRHIHYLCIAAAFLSATQVGFSLPSDCSQEAMSRTANQVGVARQLLLALPVGDGLQTDVSAAAQESIASMKTRLEDFMVAYMLCTAVDADPVKIEKELSAMSHAFVLESRSYGVNELPKEANNYGYQLKFEVRRGPTGSGLMGITAAFQIECGMDSVLAVFAPENNSWKQVLQWTSKPYKTVAGAFWAFDYGVSPPDQSGQWFVVAKSIAPWCSSTWSDIRYSVLRPVTGSLRPSVLFSGSDFMWWGSEDFGTLSVDTNKFDLRFHAASIDGGVHNRVWVRDFSVSGDTVRRIGPIAVSPRDFVDEWIVSSWGEASNWSRSTGRDELRLAHEHARKTSWEFDSVRKCTDRPDHYQIALNGVDNDHLMFFQVIGGHADYKMDAVGKSPQSQCSGPDILESIATKRLVMN